MHPRKKEITSKFQRKLKGPVRDGTGGKGVVIRGGCKYDVGKRGTRGKGARGRRLSWGTKGTLSRHSEKNVVSVKLEPRERKESKHRGWGGLIMRSNIFLAPQVAFGTQVPLHQKRNALKTAGRRRTERERRLYGSLAPTCGVN